MAKKKKAVSDRTLDALWSVAVKAHAKAPRWTEAHHIIHRRNWCTRWDWRNGIALTHEEHDDAHRRPLAFSQWVAEAWPHYEHLKQREHLLKPDFLRQEGLAEDEYRVKVRDELTRIILESGTPG